jgi:dihydrofolate reductase
MDPDIDFAAMFDQYDTFIMGRGTFEAMVGQQGSGATPGKQTLVISRTLRQQDYPDVTIIADEVEKTLTALKKKPGKDIWLFGGGSLFRSLLELRLVDTIEPAIIPVLLGGGIPLLPPPASQVKLKLTGHRVYKKSGIALLEYAIAYPRRQKAKSKSSPA